MFHPPRRNAKTTFMKSLKKIMTVDWMKGAAFAAAICGVSAATVTTASADVPILRRWANSAPTVDGVASPGEWTLAQSTPLLHGKMMSMND